MIKAMSNIVIASLVLVCLIMFWMSAASAANMPNPKERIDYWQKNFTELTASDDPRVARANRIFERVLNAAGNRYGVIPRLYIVNESPFNVVLPVSIPDGWIIMSKKVLDMCYQDKKHGDDRLAFVMSHEIAHLLDDDFWHMNFFHALESLQKNTRTSVSDNTISEIKGIVDQTEKIQAKELRADERGILFATMAGYDPGAIVQGNAASKDSFFHDWQEMLDVKKLSARLSNSTHPSSSQRSAAVLARLNQVNNQADLFKLGLIFYQAGDFNKAIKAFGEFLRYFPSREVYHNLAVSHHQLAILNYVPERKDKLLPFRLPITADPYTRAASAITRGAAGSEKDTPFQYHIDKAISYYQSAILQDEHYSRAYLNLASAYLIMNKPYKAIAILQDVKEAERDNAQFNNILGVGFYMASNSAKAMEKLKRALDQDPRYAPVHYNLGRIAFIQGNNPGAKKHWQRYVELDSDSQWVDYLAVNFNVGTQRNNSTKRNSKNIDDMLSAALNNMEVVNGVQIGNYLTEVPKSWGSPVVTRKFSLADSRYTMQEYPNGVSVVAEGGEIRVIVANADYKGKSQHGVNIGSDKKLLMSSYGMPGYTLGSAQGDNFLYPKSGVTFQLQEGKVVSWILY